MLWATVPMTHKPKRKRNKDGFVYFIDLKNGEMKIGWSVDPSRRLKEGQAWHGEEIELLGQIPGTEKDEHRIQHDLYAFRKRGEIFAMSKHFNERVKLILMKHESND